MELPCTLTSVRQGVTNPRGRITLGLRIRIGQDAFFFKYPSYQAAAERFSQSHKFTNDAPSSRTGEMWITKSIRKHGFVWVLESQWQNSIQDETQRLTDT